MQKKHQYWLIAIFLVTLLTRLILAFSIPNLTYDSYFDLRHVEYISQHGLPLYQDPLSYGGRELIFLPFFHYLSALFDLFLPLALITKILPNLLFASLTIIVYLISRDYSAPESNAPLFSAFIAGFLPILYTTNSFSASSLLLPLIFLALYAFLNINRKKYLYLYIGAFLLASLTSSATIMLLIGFSIYFLLFILEGQKVKRAELEIMLFSLFFYIWLQFVFFKDTFLHEGISFIWQNIPPQMILNYFPKITLAQALLLVSAIPFVTGVLVAYRSLFKLKDRKTFLLISFVIATTLLTWFRLMEFQLSLAFFGIILSILFSQFYNESKDYFQKTKAPQTWKIFISIIIILLIVTTVLPAIATAFSQETPSDEDIAAFSWLQENTPENSTVASLLEEGPLVAYYGQRKNFMDNRFTLVDNVEGKFTDLDKLFKTQLETEALRITDQYNIDYIVLTPQAKERYAVDTLPYKSADGCFDRIYYNKTKIYNIGCSLEKTEVQE